MNENTIERIGMALADRAYAYRLFHVALGAEPNAEELDVLASEQTRAVFGRLAKADVAKAKRLATWDEGLKDESGVFFQIVESLRAFVACDVDFVGELVASGELEG